MPGSSGAPLRRIGVCSWSLGDRDAHALATTLRDDLNVPGVQLALDPLLDGSWRVDDIAQVLQHASIAILSGMVAPVGEDYTSPASIRRTGGFAPDATWPENRARAARLAAVASDLGIDLVTMHAGAFTTEGGGLDERVVDRLRSIVATFAARGVRVGFETGHEAAETTLRMLDAIAVPDAGVNFDPANMLLYGSGDPIEALCLLLPRVVQCHVKDATPPVRPDDWGEEVVAGTGAVDWPAFFDILDGAGRPIDLVAEREAGEDRIADLRAALELIDRRGMERS